MSRSDISFAGSSIQWRKILNIIVLTAPTLGFIGAIAAVIWWERQITPLDITLLLGMYFPTFVVGVAVGYHRFFSHRSFQTGAIVRGAIAIAACMSAQGTVTSWASHHRQHHLYSDKAGDVHSPHLQGNSIWSQLRGFWHAHVGWMVVANWNEPLPYVNDLKRDRVVQAIDRLYLLWLILTLAIPTTIGGMIIGSWDGALRGLIWGGAFRLMLSFQAIFAVNSLCHLWGGQPFVTGDRSRNNVFVNLTGFGEGWHNNHHAFPYSAKSGLAWWQLDIAWWFILLLERLGLAWDVKVPSAKDLEILQKN